MRATICCLIALAGCGDDATTPPATTWKAPVSVATIAGPDTSYDWTGYSLARAGDLNGDGRPDLVMSALSANQGGRVDVFYGPLSGARTTAEASATFVGEYSFSNLGESLTHAGGCDINGDGFDDLVLGAPFADVVDVAPNAASSGDNRGKAYAFFGSATRTGTTRANAADAVFLGEDPSDAAGSTTACLGDLDGDGLGDFAVVARRNSRGARHAGAIYVFYGRAGLAGTISLKDAPAILVGEAAFDSAGVVVAPLGDIDGDGHPDLAIGAPGHDAGGAEAGAVYVVSPGGRRLTGQISLATTPKLVGPRAGARAGWSIAAAGDGDGDGTADLWVGSAALENDQAGAVWLVRGGPFTGTTGLAARGRELRGEAPGDGAGISVAGVGDLDGDGIADALVGAPLLSAGAASVGRAYLLPGTRDGERALASAPWITTGVDADELHGETVVGLGDFDGDDIPDFAISARGAGANHAGRVEIFHGQR